ncbi:hypothetical protein JFT58_22790 [Pseudomonas sp. MF6767]|uniref:hypothetical protein n=1 Tax=Pseudomonas sp. MF6767 TaxID=2797531 RepID=UPI0018E71E13|nr:hypothetical protein [Pseudomonas sp. MF6767]MBJ2281116.1 hypothetical protein [Pseudomonas sp. MF6767]
MSVSIKDLDSFWDNVCELTHNPDDGYALFVRVNDNECFEIYDADHTFDGEFYDYWIDCFYYSNDPSSLLNSEIFEMVDEERMVAVLKDGTKLQFEVNHAGDEEEE